jgi:lysozyme
MKTLILLVLTLSVNAMDLTSTLKQEEGFRSTPYADSLGFWTIGYGHKMMGRKQTPITQADAERWLAEDISIASSKVDELVGKDAPQEVKDIVTCMCFQLGIAGVKKFKNTLRLIRAKDYEGASKEMLKSEWANQTPARALRMSELMAKVS